ncbi:MAG: triose-phosphate isomerase [Acidobacteriaceae bacterium]
MRKLLIAGNWKMYKTPAETQSFVDAFLPLVKGVRHRDIVICPPFVDLATTINAVKGSDVMVGAQNMHFADEGAYTGEISPPMLLALGATHVILGHSERRQYFAESDQDVNRKLIAALKHHIVPIICIGEHEQQRESGQTEEVVCRQISLALHGIDPGKLHRMIIAYEPIWAIGTGKTATPAIAGESHLIIRSEVARLVGRHIADDLRILYGGSVKPENAEGLLEQPEIDGALVGGASLDPQSFAAVVKAGL